MWFNISRCRRPSCFRLRPPRRTNRYGTNSSPNTAVHAATNTQAAATSKTASGIVTTFAHGSGPTSVSRHNRRADPTNDNGDCTTTRSDSSLIPRR